MRLRLRRRAVKIAQEQLAQALDLSCQQVQKYERGENRISSSTLFEAAAFLGVPVGFFFEGYNGEAPGRGQGVSRQFEIADFWQSADGRLIAEAFLRIRNARARKHILGLLQAMAVGTSCDSCD